MKAGVSNVPAPKTTLEHVREMALRIIRGEALSRIAREYGYAASPSRFRIRAKQVLSPQEYAQLLERLKANSCDTRFRPAVTGNWRVNLERLQKIMGMTELEAAYLAGIIDGDGSLTLSHRRRNAARGWESIELHISISNTNQSLMSHLSQMLGAPFYSAKDRRNRKWKQHFVISFSAFVELNALLTRIIPYLIVKRRQAEIMLELVKRRLSKEPYTDEDRKLVRELRRLNRRGQ